MAKGTYETKRFANSDPVFSFWRRLNPQVSWVQRGTFAAALTKILPKRRTRHMGIHAHVAQKDQEPNFDAGWWRLVCLYFLFTFSAFFTAVAVLCFFLVYVHGVIVVACRNIVSQVFCI